LFTNKPMLINEKGYGICNPELVIEHCLKWFNEFKKQKIRSYFIFYKCIYLLT
jgi:hypothetical protein